jgi:hypothetical protein
MLRGSKPGERRGGRKRETPNRRTVLTDRILSIGSDHPTLSPTQFLIKLVKDQALPADTRMALVPQSVPLKQLVESRPGRRGARGGAMAPAPVSVPQRWTPLTLEALFGIVRDATAEAKARRKAALKIAEFLLPKAAKKPKVLPDEYGFVVNPNLASAYRDIQLELRALVREAGRNVPAIAEKIKKLEARSAAIRRRLQVPCPTIYTVAHFAKDGARLQELILLRGTETGLTEAQKAEEAHLRMRFDVFAESSDWVLRRRCRELLKAERRFEKNRFFGDVPAAPLSRTDRDDLEILRRLYWTPTSPSLSGVSADMFDEMMRDHPFMCEWPANDGKFYPPDSKVRPFGVVTISWRGMEPPPFELARIYNPPLPGPDPSAEAEKPQ